MPKTYIQKGTDVKKDLLAIFSIATKSIPEMQLDQKDLFKRDWADQQGDDEYIPAVSVFKAYEQDLEFVCKATLATAGGLIKTFLTYLQGSEFSIYDEFTQRGIRCRFSGYSNQAFYRAGQDVVVFTIKVKINNPLCHALTTTGTTITGTAGSPTVIYWEDGTTNTYATNATISKTFTGNGHFGIIVPTVL